MSERQHVWVGPETTDYEGECEICARGWSLSVTQAAVVGTLRRDADVGFTTCRRGHRIVVRRVGKRLRRAS